MCVQHDLHESIFLTSEEYEIKRKPPIYPPYHTIRVNILSEF